jgi:hypothetical protein
VEDIRALVMATASKPAGMGGVVFTNEYGHGIIDANKALTVASSLNITTSTPQLLQAGGSISEHSFKSGESLGSGCVSQTGSYCTVRARNNAIGTERYLPYQQILGDSAGWTWPTTILGGNGSWSIQAYQGDRTSGAYELFNK